MTTQTLTTDTDLIFTTQETFEMEDLFGVDAEFYMQEGDTFVVAFPAIEVFGLQRGPGGRLQVIDGDIMPNEFDWDSAIAFRDSEFPEEDFS